MMLRVGMILVVVMALPGAGLALNLTLPGHASLSAEVESDPDTYMLPIGAYAKGTLPTLKTEGRVLRQAWRIEQQGLTTLQLIRPLRAQLTEAGFNILFDCGGQECGGFDFRYNTQVMPAPDMFVDLFDFRYLAANKGATGAEDAEYVSVIVSRSGAHGYVQLIHVGSEGIEALIADRGTPTAVAKPTPDVPLVKSLVEQGHVILGDLDFETGSASLGPGPHASLRALASYLQGDGTRRIVLVGHTDAVGSLENNIALSRRRAASVLERLVSEYDVPRAQLDAEGTGYLSPIGPNLLPEGREANRRVEAVLLNTE